MLTEINVISQLVIPIYQKILISLSDMKCKNKPAVAFLSNVINFIYVMYNKNVTKAE